jgi:hypothetical protein
VKDSISRRDAEQRIGGRLHRGRYLIIEGVGYPIRRTRCKVIG